MKALAVYCGSSLGRHWYFAEAAHELVQTCASLGVEVVCGGSDVGLMGVLARSGLDHGCRVVGVSTASLIEIEPPSPALAELIIADSLSHRKEVMLRRSDAVLVLPGGLGSLDEAFEAMTLRQLGWHSKKIIFVNVRNYWQPLINAVDAMVEDGFVSTAVRQNFAVIPTVTEAVDLLLT